MFYYINSNKSDARLIWRMIQSWNNYYSSTFYKSRRQLNSAMAKMKFEELGDSPELTFPENPRAESPKLPPIYKPCNLIHNLIRRWNPIRTLTKWVLLPMKCVTEPAVLPSQVPVQAVIVWFDLILVVEHKPDNNSSMSVILLIEYPRLVKIPTTGCNSVYALKHTFFLSRLFRAASRFCASRLSTCIRNHVH